MLYNYSLLRFVVTTGNKTLLIDVSHLFNILYILYTLPLAVYFNINLKFR